MRQIPDVRKTKKIEPVDWQEYAVMCMLRMGSKVQQYDGFTPGHRVSRRTEKLPIGTVDNPNFSDFTNRNESKVTQTHQAHVKLREIQNASLESDSREKFDLPLKPWFWG